MEDGMVRAAEEGTPQGVLVSPVLSNIYLHYVLDFWFEKRYAKACRGKAHLVCYADDYVACFQYEADARHFLVHMQERLAHSNAQMDPEAAEEVGRLLSTLREAWVEAVAQVEGQGKGK